MSKPTKENAFSPQEFIPKMIKESNQKRQASE